MTMTQMQSARAGKITDEMKIVAQEEKMNIETLRETRCQWYYRYLC